MHQIEAKFRSSHNGLMMVYFFDGLFNSGTYESILVYIYNIIWILYNMDNIIWMYIYIYSYIIWIICTYYISDIIYFIDNVVNPMR